MPLRQAVFIPDPDSWRNSGSNYQFMLAWIPPADFMRLAYEGLGIRGFDIAGFKLDTAMAMPTAAGSRWGATPGLIRSMKEGIPITPARLVLEDAVIAQTVPSPREYIHKIIDANPRVKVTYHEGRNRAKLAWDMGITFMPTKFELVGLKNWFEGYEVYEAIWTRPNIEAKILKYLGISEYRLDAVG